MNDLYEYFDWINKCKIIITADSLGLHLAFAMSKKVISVFGPTDPDEVYFYNEGEYILPTKKFDCLGCYKSKCNNDEFCMDFINIEHILDAINSYRDKSRF